MWQPLLLFLKEFPQAWKIEAQAHDDADAETESDDEGDDEEQDAGEDTTKPAIKDKPAEQRPSAAYTEFLQFLQLGCGGSPIQGYPTIVIVLSTIPSEILNSTTTPSSTSTHTLDDFFTSFWGAIDGRALSGLQRSTASAKFLGALLECLVFLVRRFWKASEPESEFVRTLVKTQLERVWTELVGGTLKVEPKVVGERVCRTLEELERVDEGSWQAAWELQSTSVKDTSVQAPSLVCNILSAFIGGSGKVQEVGRELMRDVVNVALDGYQAALNTLAESNEKVKSYTEFFVSAFEILGKDLLADSAFAERINNLVTQNAYTLLTSQPSFLLTYLSSPIVEVANQQRCWQHLLSEIAAHQDTGTQSSNMSQLLGMLEKDDKLRSLRPKADELDSLVGRMLADGLGGGGSAALVKRVFKKPEPILSEHGTQSLSASLSSSFSLELDSALRDDKVSIASFEVMLDLLAVVLKRGAGSVLPDIFIFAHLLPKGSSSSPAFAVAQRIWEEWRKDASDDEKEVVDLHVKGKLRNILGDVSCQVLPEHNIQASKHLESSLYGPLVDFIPPENELNDMLESLPSDPIHASLAVLEPLIPPASMFLEESHSAQTAFDSQGHSLYARLVTALIHLVVEDRQIAKQNLWIMRHLLAFSAYAEDLINVPSGKSPIFERRAIDYGVGLGELVVKVHQAVAYVLVTSGDETARALGALSGQAKAEEDSAGLARFIVDTVEASKRTETIREFRVLCRVLQHVFDDVEKEEAERWVTFARGVERAAPNTALAILSSINAFGSEPPRLERYRNELAANITGVRPSKAETEGLALLRKLAAVAPPVDSDVVFLPQQRAVNLIKTCQQWVSSDDGGDFGEEVESEMTLIFAYVAPILQHVTGSHWAFVFDVIENNLENCAISEEDTLVPLVRTLRLIILIRDLAATNKALRAEWKEREGGVLKAVRDLAMSQLDSEIPSAPASTCRELVLSIVQDLPESLVDHNSLPKMCHLLLDPSADVQKMAYNLLRQAARKHTEHLVVEAGVDTEDKFKAELPHELLVALQQQSGDFALGEVEQEQNIFGYFLGWMLLFDLFEDTSLKVRSGYIEQLRALDVISLNFIPTIFGILGLDRGGIAKAFKLGVWDVQEFYVSHYDTGESFSLPVFAAHLYYRSLLTVPSIIYGWVLDCKDVQLSDAVGSYTSTHFSPALIEAELENVKGAAELSGDENLSVKVAKSVTEVAAAYSVDEHQLEIRVRIPSDWPLHRIEVKEVKRVGVDENRWRAWILAVQQTMWAQNGGRIVDGLALFKKNVTLHFEGQVECAICYSYVLLSSGHSARLTSFS
ncbi:hypothetical protein PQX77_000989 [Marasmius sp. AFHP31]|nr:hypothetical protein PQX77_000989 [Marasmius sp. AFHP31]